MAEMTMWQEAQDVSKSGHFNFLAFYTKLFAKKKCLGQKQASFSM